MSENRSVSLDLRSLVLWPALITLAVTLVRLAGELLRWSDRFFSRAAGGAGSVVGIVWLVPVFAVYFALRLLRAGRSPRSTPWSIAGGLVGLVAIAPLALVWDRLGLSPVAQVLAFCFTFPFVAWAVGCAWPALAKTLLAYGLAARIPVIVVMLLAILGRWGTHYELGRPDLPPLEPPLLEWLVIGLVPQLGFWVSFTVVAGSLFGGLAAVIQGRASRSAIPAAP
jgi:hypothetical protein